VAQWFVPPLARSPENRPFGYTMTIQVTLISHSPEPMRSLYMAYRTCYSQLTPKQILSRIDDDRITDAQMRQFIEERLKTGHASPLEQISFEFGISGVSRAFSHQFVRHRVGISFEQQSQRYVTYKDGEFPYTVPETVRKAGMQDRMDDLFGQVAKLYDEMVAAGVPAEDARFLLPNATNTNFKITVNFQALLHICDLRLCTRAQWEFRKVAALMRSEVMKVVPELGRYLQPKCGELRMGYCDESEKDWEACPIGRVRPHKDVLFRIYDSYRKGELQPLREQDWDAIEEKESAAAAEPY
jgi:thymidylate synthase (FAD)